MSRKAFVIGCATFITALPLGLLPGCVSSSKKRSGSSAPAATESVAEFCKEWGAAACTQAAVDNCAAATTEDCVSSQSDFCGIL